MEKLKVKDLRLGNYFLYHMVDKYDERKEWDEVAQIDAGDITYLAGLDKNSKGDKDFKPIGLTKEWLLKLGFMKYGKNYKRGLVTLWQRGGNWGINFFTEDDEGFMMVDMLNVLYVHQLQNLYYALMGEELRLKDRSCK